MSGFHSPNFPIYQADTARAANPDYFRTVPFSREGIAKAIMGHIIADQTKSVSYMIVRRGFREPRIAQHMQTVHMGMRGYMRAPRTVYNIVRSDYVVVRQHWADGAVHELSFHPNPREARKAFKQLTGRSVNGDWADVPEPSRVPKTWTEIPFDPLTWTPKKPRK